MINQINLTPYPIGNMQTVYTSEGNTALELAGITAKKVNECVDVVNGVDALATQARQVVTEMQDAQAEFIVANNDVRTQIIADNQTLLDELSASNTTYQNNANAEFNTFKNDINAEKTLFTNTANSMLSDMQTQQTNFVNQGNAIIADMQADQAGIIDTLNNVTVPNVVDTKIDGMVTDGTFSDIINAQLLSDINNRLSLQENKDRILNVRDYGVKGNGTDNDYTSLNALLVSLDTNIKDLYFNSGVYVIGSNITFPKNIRIVFANGAVLKPNTGVTITINGEILAPIEKIFDGVGTIAGKPKLEKVYPQWFGAKGDGVTDDTVSFQKALNFASLIGGTVKVIPTDTGYLIGDSINMPMWTKLIGNSEYGNIGPDVYWAVPGSQLGVKLLFTSKTKSPFIIPQNNCGITISGFQFVYPNQLTTGATPDAYPPAIFFNGSNQDVTIQNIFLENCYRFINATTLSHNRLLVRNIFGGVLSYGIYLDGGTDSDRLENIEFAITFNNTNLHDYVKNNMTAFIFGREDNIQCNNLFAYGGNIGIRYVIGGLPGELAGATYGQFSNIGLDMFNQAHVYVEDFESALIFNNISLASAVNGFLFTADNPAGHVIISGIAGWAFTGSAIHFSPSAKMSVDIANGAFDVANTSGNSDILFENSGACELNLSNVALQATSGSGGSQTDIAFSGAMGASSSAMVRMSNVRFVSGNLITYNGSTGKVNVLIDGMKFISTITVGTTQVSVPHGLPFIPRKFFVEMRSAGTIWKTAYADATNLYLTASADGCVCDLWVG